LPVKPSDHLFGDVAFRELDERKATRPAGVPVHWQRHLRGLADGSEVLAQLALVHAIV